MYLLSSTHKLKQKRFVLGTVLEMEIRRGVWSEVGRTREVSVVLGEAVHCAWFTKTRSSRANTGLGRLLLQV